MPKIWQVLRRITDWVHVGSSCALINAVHFPATIQKILGPRGFSTLHGKAHTQIRKIMVPAFSPKTAEKYIPQTLELAKSTCADWAATTEAKGEDGMKAYTFQESHGKLAFLTSMLASRAAWITFFVIHVASTQDKQ